ncbi:aldehyde dehydrogenase [Fusobacterium sp. MFO224]|uniref:aldehyde dehydrogenase n=1 Tax=Fusobacterium sp. MFO224 TaxID=3378070 RepID=UPI0038537160
MDILKEMKSFYQTRETKDISFRINQLLKLKEVILSNEDEIIKALKLDLGRPSFESYLTEIGIILNSISYTVDNLKKWSKLKKVRTPMNQLGASSYIKPEPYGVVLIISPFNFPFNLCIEPLIGAISAGNCAVIKPSEETPHVSKLIEKMFHENFSKRYIQVVQGGKNVINELIHTPFDYIFFTGSVSVGKIIMKAASENLTPVTLELGGKSPCIIDKDANLKIAAERVAWGKFLNAGQICIAPDYLFVHEIIKDEFIQELKEVINKFYGLNIHESPDFSRIINEKHTERLIKILKADKNKIIFGGNSILEEKYIEPTLMDNVSWEDNCMEDEIFGPILPIIPFNDIDQVIDVINSKPKPLALYIFTDNVYLENRILDRTSSGGVCINDVINHYSNHHLPFGGVGNSGIGSYHGKESFKTFSHMKGILSKSTKISNTLAFPPYTLKKLHAIKKVLK